MKSSRVSGLFIGIKNTHAGFLMFLSENIQSYTVKSGDRFEVAFKLPPDSCNILLSLESQNHFPAHRIVTEGRLDWERLHQECSGFELLPPCGLVFDSVETSCTGTFFFNDGDAKTALQADLKVECK